MLSVNKNKAQILIITLFILGISMILVLVSYFLVNEQIRRIRRIFESYNSYAYAESGIEISSYYHIINPNVSSLLNLSISSEENFGLSETLFPCNEFYRPDPPIYITCAETKINKTDGLQFDIITHSAVFHGLTTDVLSTRIISNGIYKNTSRTLIFNFFVK